MPPKDLETTLIGGAAGAVAGFVVTLLTSRWKLWRLHHCLRFEPHSGGGTHVSARVYNSYIFPLSSVFAYITIEHELTDVVGPPHGAKSFVNKECPSKVREDRLCWSVAAPYPNPPSVDIYPGERQALAIANLDKDWIEFPSEDGWGTMGKTSRVFLKRKRYTATIKIVSMDTKAKTFAIVIDPDDLDSPLKLL